MPFRAGGSGLISSSEGRQDSIAGNLPVRRVAPSVVACWAGQAHASAETRWTGPPKLRFPSWWSVPAPAGLRLRALRDCAPGAVAAGLVPRDRGRPAGAGRGARRGGDARIAGHPAALRPAAGFADPPRHRGGGAGAGRALDRSPRPRRRWPCWARPRRCWRICGSSHGMLRGTGIERRNGLLRPVLHAIINGSPGRRGPGGAAGAAGRGRLRLPLRPGAGAGGSDRRRAGHRPARAGHRGAPGPLRLGPCPARRRSRMAALEARLLRLEQAGADHAGRPAGAARPPAGAAAGPDRRLHRCRSQPAAGPPLDGAGGDGGRGTAGPDRRVPTSPRAGPAAAGGGCPGVLAPRMPASTSAGMPPRRMPRAASAG